eukprot:GEMP01049174.1.p1 GENE.GEMP01049174.1~~GEMP01049174.1.p1  ORF type:complete len:185 (+),score=31.42 GEMP01049174.1:155-709(+)
MHCGHDAHCCTPYAPPMPSTVSPILPPPTPICAASDYCIPPLYGAPSHYGIPPACSAPATYCPPAAYPATGCGAAPCYQAPIEEELPINLVPCCHYGCTPPPPPRLLYNIPSFPRTQLFTPVSQHTAAPPLDDPTGNYDRPVPAASYMRPANGLSNDQPMYSFIHHVEHEYSAPPITKHVFHYA